jgi:hypothetical protein
MLRTGAFRTAIDAFGDAAKATDADDKRGRALGMQLLIRQSKPVGYIPKAQPKTAGKPQPIDIVDPAERKKALDALLIDAKAAAEPRLKAIEGAKTLAPLMDAARIIGDLWAIEMAATGSGDGAKAASSTIGKQSHELISGAVKQMNDRVTQVYSDASSEIWEVDQWNRRTRLIARRGLDGPGGSALRDVIATCEKVVPVARDFAKVSGNEDLTADAKAAADLYDRATEALHHNFQPQSGSGGPRLGLPVGPARRVGN